jgi:hypothetical protein
VETKNNDATTRAQTMRRGNETGCVVKSCSGLFDIVKKDGARSMPRATFAFARGRSHISGSRALRHRRPSASDGQAAGSLERNRLDAITVSLQVSSWSHGRIESLRVSRSCSGRDERRWPTRRAMKKTDAVSRGGASVCIQPSVAWSCQNPWDKEATL